MAIKLADTLAPMADFPAAMAEHVEFADGENLQKKLDDGSLGGGVTYIELSQEEYDALSDEEKNNGSEYRTHDTGNIYKNGVLYGGKEPVECTFEEYKQLEADGLVDPDTDYIIVSDESGILLASGDIGYDNSASGLEATNVQGAIDKTVEKINELMDDENVSAKTTWSSSKIDNEIGNIQTYENGRWYLEVKPKVIDVYYRKKFSEGEVALSSACTATLSTNVPELVKSHLLNYAQNSLYEANMFFDYAAPLYQIHQIYSADGTTLATRIVGNGTYNRSFTITVHWKIFL